MRYAVRTHHRYDNPPCWGAYGSKLFDSKSDALAMAKWANQEWGKHWVYAVFEYHGRGDYRIVDPKEKINE